MTKKSEVASNYGEGDIEAKAMTKADQAGQPTASPARVPKKPVCAGVRNHGNRCRQEHR